MSNYRNEITFKDSKIIHIVRTNVDQYIITIEFPDKNFKVSLSSESKHNFYSSFMFLKYSARFAFYCQSSFWKYHKKDKRKRELNYRNYSFKMRSRFAKYLCTGSEFGVKARWHVRLSQRQI